MSTTDQEEFNEYNFVDSTGHNETAAQGQTYVDEENEEMQIAETDTDSCSRADEDVRSWVSDAPERGIEQGIGSAGGGNLLDVDVARDRPEESPMQPVCLVARDTLLDGSGRGVVHDTKDTTNCNINEVRSPHQHVVGREEHEAGSSYFLDTTSYATSKPYRDKTHRYSLSSEQDAPPFEYNNGHVSHAPKTTEHRSPPPSDNQEMLEYIVSIHYA
jgi:hypothetical protein